MSQNNPTSKRIFLSPRHMGGDELKVVHKAFGSNYITRLGCYTACLGFGGVRHRAQGIKSAIKLKFSAFSASLR